MTPAASGSCWSISPPRAACPSPGSAATTRDKLASRLDYGLEPINPLDAWGTGHDYQAIFADCMSALLADPDTAIGALCVETRTGKALHHAYAEAMQQAHAGSEKPVVFINNLAAPGDDDLAVTNTRAGLPVLIGLNPALAAIRGAMARRDFRLRPPMAPAAPPSGLRARWQKRLAGARHAGRERWLAALRRLWPAGAAASHRRRLRRCCRGRARAGLSRRPQDGHAWHPA